MKLEEIIHRWPPNINRYEQKFFGIPMMTLMLAGVVGIGLFVFVSQVFVGIPGMIIGAVSGLFGAGLIVGFTTKLGFLNDMTIPVYVSQRLAARGDRMMEIPMIVSSDASRQTIVIEDWDGEEQGVLE